MPNKMLIDATHPEETRVVVLRGNKVEEFDFESAQRKQLRGNIYLAKVTRVEPSLQAAFVDYGGNRHGFLAFSEIHPDYYQIPVADRQALIDEESRAQRAADEESERRRRPRRRRAAREDAVRRSAPVAEDEPAADRFAGEEVPHEAAEIAAAEAESADASPPAEGEDTPSSEEAAAGGAGDEAGLSSAHRDEAVTDDDRTAVSGARQEAADPGIDLPAENGHGREEGNGQSAEDDEEVVESVGGADALEEVPERMVRPRRRYKIQEVIKRRQIMLVQVVKEERGTKGAALTTYLSLAGRYSVLMPNTARGGGISRKITNPEDRKRLKEVAEELEVPEGMGVILRTAGANRTKTEIKRDFEYLLRLWETVRDLTLKSTAPSLVYEEGSLVKRAIRDLYSKEIDEIIVAGDAACHEAKEFMRMLMPSHVKNIKAYKDTQPLFTRHGIEAQLDAMFQPTVQLKSGGYIVLNQAEALVAIDVNSGRATREHSIEETALKTNLEAAAEIARQLRLRDLAGLIVIDFIDMDEKRNNRAVERKLKEALKSDRARIQVGRISHFGLLEMSRQRIRTSVLESSTEICPHCGGTGHVRSVSSVALQLLRTVEELLLKGATNNLIVRTRSDIALYVLNNKRAHLRALEERFRILIAIHADATITGQPPFVIERGEQVMSMEQAKAIAAEAARALPRHEEEEEVEAGEEAAAETDELPATEAREGRRRRRGRRGRGHGREGRGEPPSYTAETVAEHTVAHAEDFEALPEGEAATSEYGGAEPSPAELRGEGERRRRRRGRRGGRRRRHRGEAASTFGEQGVAAFGDRRDMPEPADDYAADFEPEESGPSPAEHAGGEAPPPAPSELPPAPQAPAGETEAPRRRSTVREPAPVFGSGEAPPPAPPETPSPQPVIHEHRADEAEKPRRTGWWSRRV